MGKDLLQKHQNDPAWAEVIRLYSGLFDTQDEREDFILDLADKDILLAAECKTSSVEEENGVSKNIIRKSESLAKTFVKSEISAQGLLALVELDETDKVVEILQNIKNPNKKHKILLETIIQKSNTNKALTILLMLLNSIKKKGMHNLSIWAFQSFDKEISNIHSPTLEEIAEKLIQNGNLSLLNIFESWIEKYELYKEKSISILLTMLVKHLIEKAKPPHLKLASNLVRKYKLESIFPINEVVEKLIHKGSLHSLRTAEQLIEKYQLYDKYSTAFIVQKLIQNNAHYLQLAEQLIEKYQLQNMFHIAELFEKLIKIAQHKTDYEIAEIWIEKYPLIDKKIIEKCIKNLVNKKGKRHLLFTKQLLLKYQLQDIFPNIV